MSHLKLSFSFGRRRYSLDSITEISFSELQIIASMESIKLMLRRLSSIELPIKIQYGTTNKANKYRSILFTFFAAVITMINFLLALNIPIDDLPARNVSSENLRSSMTDKMTCRPLYGRCWCWLWTENAENPYNCNLENCRRYFHPLVLVWFVLQICLIRELFTCIGQSRQIFVRLLYVLSILILCGLTIGIYWNECFHYKTAMFFNCSCVTLGILVVYDLQNPRETESSWTHAVDNTNMHRMRRNEPQDKACDQLI